jgi:heme oxygenase
MEQGIEQGKKQEAVALILRQLNRRVGMLTPQLQERIQNLSTMELEDLGEALLDFTSLRDLKVWFDSK